MQATLCPFCMRTVQADICPYCGRDVHYPGYPGHLPVGYALNGRSTYILGAYIGQGGFGITYIAIDIITGQRVAIKEYYPSHCCLRTNSVEVYSGAGQEATYSKGKQHFILEAQMLQSLSDLDSVVKVLDYFEANNSAYLVMEYLDGPSLKDHVEKQGKLPAQAFLKQMKPLMADMEKMHRRGVVHRDIAPDNIIMLPDGRLKLIDFGAARSYVGNKSMTVVVKKGFAPVEQYMRKGSNASTDVYALAATIYYCITGIIPPDSAERQYGEAELQAPTELGADITTNQERALEKALKIQPKERTADIATLMKDLYIPQTPAQPPKKSANPLSDPPKAAADAENSQKTDLSTLLAKIPPLSSLKDKLQPKWIIATAAAAAVFIGGIALIGGSDGKEEPVSVAAPSIAVPIVQTPSETTVPAPTEPQPPARTYVMDSSGYGDYYFWGQTEYTESDVRSVRFVSSLEDAPSDAHDISEAQDRSILMWMNDGNLTVAANGQISPGSNASRMVCTWENLEHIEFGNVFDTSNVTDMSHMFQGCNKLTELDLSCFDTSNVTNMSTMFQDCTGLESLDVSSFDTSQVTNMSCMFYRCEALAKLDVSVFITSKVSGMSYMFAECTQLSVLDIAGFDTSNVTNMSNMFMNCHKITYLDVSGFDTSSVESTYYMFYNCTELSNMDVSNFDTSQIINMGYMFYGCKKLSKLDVSNFKITEDTYTHDMFGGCSFPLPSWYKS